MIEKRIAPLRGRKRPPFSDGWKKRISKAMKGKPSPRKGIILTEETKQKIRLARSKQIITDETKRKISKALTGKPKTEEHSKKVGLANSISLKGNPKISGKNCHFWVDGKSFEPYSVDWTDDLKRAIRKRDRYICGICGKEPAIIVHH